MYASNNNDNNIFKKKSNSMWNM